jgi:hypothetical protein
MPQQPISSRREPPFFAARLHVWFFRVLAAAVAAIGPMRDNWLGRCAMAGGPPEPGRRWKWGGLAQRMLREPAVGGLTRPDVER